MQRPSFRRTKEVAHLDPLIDDVVAQMNTVGVDSDQYPSLLAYLERLHKIKTHERRELVSPDTIAICATNLLGILLIVAYEQKHVITSKGFTQILRSTRPNVN